MRIGEAGGAVGSGLSAGKGGSIMAKKLLCQECGGNGGWSEYPAGAELGSMWVECGWCGGDGKVDNVTRGAWLNEQSYHYRDEKGRFARPPKWERLWADRGKR